MGMRQGLSRVRRRCRHHLSQRKDEALCRSAGQGGRGADLHAAGCSASQESWRPCSRRSRRNGASSISCLHSIAFAPKEDLQGRVVDCSKDGFLLAMELSCWSFIRMAKLAEPLMKDGGTLFTMTYYGSQMVVENYNIMGPVKAALEVRRRAIWPPSSDPRASGCTPFRRAAEDPRGLGHQRLRQASAEGAIEGAEPQPRLDRRRRSRRRLPRHGRRQADHRRDALHRRRLSHHRLAQAAFWIVDEWPSS